MNGRIPGFALAALLAAVPAAAQDSGGSLLQDVMRAMTLPATAKEARSLGVPEPDLQRILIAARERHIPAGSVADLLSAENEAIRKNGPIDNFGAFVQQKLDAGLRGRDLAAAIHAEHAARGMGKGKMPGSVGAGGKPGTPGKSGDHDMSDEHGRSGEHGKAGEQGKSDEHDRKGGK